jgi:hypothetical protein
MRPNDFANSFTESTACFLLLGRNFNGLQNEGEREYWSVQEKWIHLEQRLCVVVRLGMIFRRHEWGRIYRCFEVRGVNAQAEVTSIALIFRSSYLLRGLLDLSESYSVTSITQLLSTGIESAINYPDFLFPFLFFRAPPTVLPSTTSAISRVRFGCRPSDCAVGDPATTDTGCATAVGFASGSCSPNDLVSTLSPPSAGSTTEEPGITNFGSENTARYVLRVSGN